MYEIILYFADWSGKIREAPVQTAIVPRAGEAVTFNGTNYVVAGVWHHYDEGFIAVALDVA
ncbi:MAG: hypothetical protein ACR2QJ_02680 [Geminicoccaceae bacterium]